MAFKSVEQFNDDRYHNLFRIPNDSESVDVIFLYTSKSDMLVADAHYVRSSEYSGYVHCCGAGCPACSKGIRVQNKLFIPVYNINKGAIEFWDKTMTFEPQMQKDVFDKFPNPSEYVFRITRHGAYKDVNTRYEIVAVGRNSLMSYSQILAKFNTKMPDCYENIIKSYLVSDLTRMLATSGSEGNIVTQDYVPIPRAGYQSSIPDTYVNVSEAVDSATEPEFLDDEDELPDDGDIEGELPNPTF